MSGHPGTVVAAIVLAWVSLVPWRTEAQETDPLIFLGQEIVAEPRAYLVSKSGNVRAAPKRNAKKVGKVRKGERFVSPGRHRGGAWIALRRDGEDVGFVYQTLIVPVIDGSLESDLTGKVSGGGAMCRYHISHRGRSEVEGSAVQTADYDLTLRCARDGAETRPIGFMFLTESPYNLSRDPLFQINLDLLEIAGEEDPPSVSMVWNRRDGMLRVEDVRPQVYARDPDPKETSADTLKQALEGAVTLSLGAWNGKVWDRLPR